MERFPFDNPLRWHIKNRYQHLIEAVRGNRDRLHKDYRELLERRVRSMDRWRKVRLVFMVLMYLSIISSIVSAVFAFAPSELDDAEAGFNLLTNLLGAFTGLFVLLFLLTTRLLGQLEIDVLALLPLAVDAKNRKRS